MAAHNLKTDIEFGGHIDKSFKESAERLKKELEEIKKQAKETHEMFSKFGEMLAGFGATFLGVNILEDFWGKAAEQGRDLIEIQDRLKLGIENQFSGLKDHASLAEEATKRMIDFADAQERVGVVNAERIQALEGELGTYGASETGMRNLTKALLDLDAAKGKERMSTADFQTQGREFEDLVSKSTKLNRESMLLKFGLAKSDINLEQWEKDDQSIYHKHLHAKMLEDAIENKYGGENLKKRDKPLGQIDLLQNKIDKFFGILGTKLTDQVLGPLSGFLNQVIGEPDDPKSGFSKALAAFDVSIGFVKNHLVETLAAMGIGGVGTAYMSLAPILGHTSAMNRHTAALLKASGGLGGFKVPGVLTGALAVAELATSTVAASAIYHALTDKDTVERQKQILDQDRARTHPWETQEEHDKAVKQALELWKAQQEQKEQTNKANDALKTFNDSMQTVNTTLQNLYLQRGQYGVGGAGDGGGGSGRGRGIYNPGGGGTSDGGKGFMPNALGYRTLEEYTSEGHSSNFHTYPGERMEHRINTGELGLGPKLMAQLGLSGARGDEVLTSKHGWRKVTEVSSKNWAIEYHADYPGQFSSGDERERILAVRHGSGNAAYKAIGDNDNKPDQGGKVLSRVKTKLGNETTYDGLSPETLKMIQNSQPVTININGHGHDAQSIGHEVKIALAEHREALKQSLHNIRRDEKRTLFGFA